METIVTLEKSIVRHNLLPSGRCSGPMTGSGQIATAGSMDPLYGDRWVHVDNGIEPRHQIDNTITSIVLLNDYKGIS